MKINSATPAKTGMESDRLGIGPAAPPTPASLRFVTTGIPPQSSGFSFPNLGLEELRGTAIEPLARAATEFAERANSLADRSKPHLLNPNGRIPDGQCRALLNNLSRTLTGISAQQLDEVQQRDYSQLRKLARNFAEFSKSRPESLVQDNFPYMVDVLLDGCKAVLRDKLPVSKPDADVVELIAASIKSNVIAARASASNMTATSELERIYEHYGKVEQALFERRLPKVLGGESALVGLTAHELAACFYAKQYAVATAVAEKALEYSEHPTASRQCKLHEELLLAASALIKTTALTDNPFSHRYNDFRLVLEDFKSLLQFNSLRQNFDHKSTIAAVQKFSELLQTEARLAAWSFPGMELAERGGAGDETARTVSEYDRTATWAEKFRPNKAMQKLAALPANGDREIGEFERYVGIIAERLTQTLTARAALVPPSEPFVIGIYNRTESAVLPRVFVNQTVVMQEEHRVPENLRGPNCGIMTIAPQDEIARWAQEATVFSVQKGRNLLGALYSFISQKNQPKLTGQLIEIINRSPSADLLKPGAPVICTELVLTKKGGNDLFGRVPENRYRLMDALWRGSVCSQYYDNDTVLCLGICRKDPPNTAISAHQRLGWKIVPDVEFRFNDRSSYYVMYQELHPRDSLIAQSKEHSEKVDLVGKIRSGIPVEERLDDYSFGGIAPHDALRTFENFTSLPRWGPAKRSAIALHANRVAVGVLAPLLTAAAFAPTPPNFANPKEFLIQHCGDQPVYGPLRTEIALATHNLKSEDRKKLMSTCLIPVGQNSLMYIDKYYLLTSDPTASELREVIQKRFPERQIRSIVQDELHTPEMTLLTARIQFAD